MLGQGREAVTDGMGPKCSHSEGSKNLSYISFTSEAIKTGASLKLVLFEG